MTIYRKGEYRMQAFIPDTHRDLFSSPVHGVLTTMMPDGTPQSTVVWVDYDSEDVLISTTLERQKGRNMRTNPKVALLVIDPKNSSRWIQIQGRVKELTQHHANALADKLTHRYTGKKHFYGDIYPPDQKDKETRIVVKIEPLKVSLDAIFR